MDKELSQLHDLARAKLLELREYYKTSDPKNSNLKRVRKALSNLDLAPELYGDILSDASSSDFDPKGLTKAIRNHEEQTMRAFQLLNDDTIHHTVQQRTGGDALATAKGDVIRGAIQRLQDRGIRLGNTSGPGGNVTAQVSLSNFAHKADDTATGLERQSGIGKNPDKATTAHSKGTAGFAKNFTPAQLADEKALAKALEESAIAQKELTQVGVKTDAPRQQAIKDLTGDPLAYSPDATAADVAKTRQAILQTDPAAIKASYLELTGGVAKYGVKFGALLPAAGIAFDALDAQAKIDQASKPDATGLDKFQAGLASTTLATSVVPEPTAQVVNFATGAANLVIDLGKDFMGMLTNPKKPTEQELDFSTL